jgi:hypothetical protein
MALKATKISNAAADNFRLLKGKYVTSADGDADYIAFEIPKRALITFVAVDIKTAYTGSSTGTLTIGIKEPGTAISASQIADDTVTLSEVTGTKVVQKAVYLDKGGVVTLGVVKGNSAADIVARLFLEYTVIN